MRFKLGDPALSVSLGGRYTNPDWISFIENRTTPADFEHGFGLYRGPEMIERFRGANICTGGFLAGAAESDYRVAQEIVSMKPIPTDEMCSICAGPPGAAASADETVPSPPAIR